MKKITLQILTVLTFVFSWQVNAQYTFPAVAGPVNVVAGSPVTISINDLANTAAVPSGTYGLFNITVDWTAGSGGPWSSEAQLSITTANDDIIEISPSSGGGSSSAATTLTFTGLLPVGYDPDIDGTLDLTFNQSYAPTDANWSNIIVTLDAAPEVPANDECANAETIVCGGQYIGDTTFANPENPDPGICDTTAGTAGAVWYTFTGANTDNSGAAVGSIGDEVTLDLGASTFDTKIRVFEGSCGALTCVVGNDDVGNGPLTSLVTFQTVVGTEYYVLVHGFSAEVGEYTMDVSCVAPPACTPVVVDSTTVVPDCANSQFSVDVVVSAVGDGTFVSDGTTDYPVVAGTVTAGPYATGTTVTLDVVHSDSACDFSLGDFSYDACPIIVTCGTPVNTTYCYPNDDDTIWTFTSSDGSVLKVDFIEGYFEDCCDDIIIYDGADTSAAVLFASDTNFNNDATGITATSTGDTISVRIDSDGSVSCDSGSGSPALNFDVVCLACTPGEATTTVIEDCDASTYTIEVVVTTPGDATDITDGVTTLPFTGTQTFGPYAFGVDTTLGVEHSDVACDFTLGTYGFLACPPANDDCANAIALTVNADYDCGVVTAGTVAGATDSGADDATCFGTPDDDVWYSFTATAESHRISLINLAGSTSDMYMTFYDASGGCGALGSSIACSDPQTANLSGLTIGVTYFVQVYTWTNIGGQDSTFDICVGTAPIVVPPACGENFYDTGGAGADYSANEDYTITICPDNAGDVVTATFNSFLVEGRGADDCWDWLYIYDGDDTSGTAITPASLGLGAGTSGFCYQTPTDGTADLVGQAIEASSASGCLTFRFTSDGSGQYEGWDATITCATLGTTDYNMNELFSYYPNPVTNTLNLKGHNTIDNVLVYNMLGQEVLRAAPNAVNSELDMSGLQTGAYFVRVTVGDATKTIRVLKN